MSTIPADAEEVRIEETGARYYRIHGGRYDRRWSYTVETPTGFLTSARLASLGTVEIVATADA